MQALLSESGGCNMTRFIRRLMRILGGGFIVQTSFGQAQSDHPAVGSVRDWYKAVDGSAGILAQYRGFVGGRFDGMSFHGDECRIVILSTLPRAINTQEEFFCAYLRDAAFMKRRLNARIIQALGRCNRASDDFAIYFLCDKRFDTHFGSESNRVGISRNIAAEIDMAQDLSVEDSNELVQRMEKFFSEDFQNMTAILLISILMFQHTGELVRYPFLQTERCLAGTHCLSRKTIR